MLKIIDNITRHKHASILNADNHFLDSFCRFNLFSSFFKIQDQYLNNKEKKLKNIMIAKKKYDYKNITYAYLNCLLGNTSYCTNNKETEGNAKKKYSIDHLDIKKQKDIDYYTNYIMLNCFLNEIKQSNINNTQESHKIFTKKISSVRINKNQNDNNKIYKLNNMKKINDFYLFKINHQSSQKTINLVKDNINIINNIAHDSKNTNVSSDPNNTKNNLVLSNTLNKIDIILDKKYPLHGKHHNQEELTQIDIQPKIVFKDSNNFSEWQNLINHKILLLIGNKNSQAEININLKSLGLINILINIKNNTDITLKFVSQNNKVRFFLDDYIPLLRHKLRKKGITLSKYKIFTSLKNYEINNYKNFSNKNTYYSDKLYPQINIYKKNTSAIKYKKTDWYV